jgi:hypothetical protein
LVLVLVSVSVSILVLVSRFRCNFQAHDLRSPPKPDDGTH